MWWYITTASFLLFHSYPIGSCHLHYHLSGSSAKVAAVAAHHHSAALPIPQVDRGQQALDVVLKVVPPAFEHSRFPPQPTGAGTLVFKGGGLDRHHRDGVRLHPPRWHPKSVKQGCCCSEKFDLVSVLEFSLKVCLA